MTTRIASLILVSTLLLVAVPTWADALRVVATTSDLADLARSVGGDATRVTSLAKGPQDPHFVEPRPSFVRDLHRADVLVRVGMDLEVGWLPALLRSARNPDVMPGGAGYVDASSVIAPLEVPTAKLDRSQGDVHPYGNPHYLTDPLNGLAVAALLRDRFTALRPAEAESFEVGYADFAGRLARALVGEALAGEQSPERLLHGLERGEFDSNRLGGWLGRARQAEGSRAVQDHRAWPYFAHRFGLELVDTLEPRPGIAPTTTHLQRVVERMRAEQVSVVLSNSYFDPRHARFVARETGARVAEMAHQVGSRPGTDDYLATIDYNVGEVFGTP